MSKEFTTYELMLETAKKCQDCGLCEERTNVVISDGNSKAKLLIIGEGPGEQEDLQGIPFVGKAGQLLNKILEAAGIDRQQETYICNVVKCRPPKNRVPSDDEAKACWQYLKYQIEYVNPEIILFLGATAVEHALGLPKPRITRLHGIWFTTDSIETELQFKLDPERHVLFQGKLLMPFFHPSYLLRNASKEKGSPKWLTWQAIKEVKNKLNKIQ